VTNPITNEHLDALIALYEEKRPDLTYTKEAIYIAFPAIAAKIKEELS